jgi:hypothetical protein
MAAITKSSVKIRSRWIRTRTIIYCVVVSILCFGMIRGSIFMNRDFLSDPSEKYGLLPSIPIKSINNNDEKANSNRAGAVVVSNNFNNNQKKKAVSSASSSKELETEQPKQLDFPKSNKDHFHNPAAADNREDIYIYHHTLRSSAGKEGAVVLDMLMGHAFAYQQGAIYGGSCGEGNDVGAYIVYKLYDTDIVLILYCFDTVLLYLIRFSLSLSLSLTHTHAHAHALFRT